MTATMLKRVHKGVREGPFKGLIYGPEKVGKGGIVRETAVHRQVLMDTLAWAQANGFVVKGLIRSPIEGSSGNVEFLVWLRLGNGDDVGDLTAVVANVL